MCWSGGVADKAGMVAAIPIVLLTSLALLILPTVAVLGVAALAGIVAHQRRVLATSRRDFARVQGEWRQLLEALEVTPVHFALFNAHEELLACNASYRSRNEQAFLALPRPLLLEDIMREAARSTIPPECVEDEVRTRLARYRDTDKPFDYQCFNGGWVRISKKRLSNGSVAGFGLDVTELVEQQAALTASQARFQALAEAVPAGIWQIDRQGRTVYANAHLLALLGVADAAALDGLDVAALFPEVPGADGPLGFPSGSSCETCLHAAAGARRVAAVVSPWVDDAEGHASCVLTLTDVTAMRDAQARIEHLAHHDPLTDLGNRTVFNAAMSAVAVGRDSSAVLLIDLDHFKSANDRFGHAVGDAILCEVADRLRRAVRGGDTVCRLGGDEFAVVMRECGPAEAEAVGRRIASELLLPFAASGQTVQLSGSIGLTLASAPHRDPAALLREADLALYSVKRRGRAGMACYEPSLAA